MQIIGQQRSWRRKLPLFKWRLVDFEANEIELVIPSVDLLAQIWFILYFTENCIGSQSCRSGAKYWRNAHPHSCWVALLFLHRAKLKKKSALSTKRKHSRKRETRLGFKGRLTATMTKRKRKTTVIKKRTKYANGLNKTNDTCIVVRNSQSFYTSPASLAMP